MVLVQTNMMPAAKFRELVKIVNISQQAFILLKSFIESHLGWRMFAPRNKAEDLRKNSILPITRCYEVNENLRIIYGYKEFIPLIDQEAVNLV